MAVTILFREGFLVRILVIFEHRSDLDFNCAESLLPGEKKVRPAAWFNLHRRFRFWFEFCCSAAHFPPEVPQENLVMVKAERDGSRGKPLTFQMHMLILLG